LSDAFIVLNQFINFFLVKVISCCHRSSTSSCVTQISSSWCHPYMFWTSDAQCSHQHSRHHKQPVFGSEFQLERLFWQSKMNHSMLLKVPRWVLNVGIHFTHNSITPS
jgi:hypothetical protein